MNNPTCQDHGEMELILVHAQSDGLRKNFWRCKVCNAWQPARTIEEQERTAIKVERFGGGQAPGNPLGDAMRVRRPEKE